MGCVEGVKKENTHTHKDTHTTSLALSPFLGLSFYFSQLDAPGQITISPSQKHFSSRDYKGEKKLMQMLDLLMHTHTHIQTQLDALLLAAAIMVHKFLTHMRP